VRYFFDTSVLIPVFLDDHLHHEASLAALLKASPTNSCCAAHTLAEIFSSLTRMPGQSRTAPEEAMLFLESLTERLSFIALEQDEYWLVLKQCSELGIAGGVVYDALLARCAIKSKAEILYTWDVGDFRRLGPDIAKRVRTP
jgi:predicted nucleic acid-binding protein